MIDMRIAATKRLLWGCAFALALTALPAIAISAPAVSRADPNCAEGFVWSVDLHQCVPGVPAVNGPGGPAVNGPGGLGGPGGPGGLGGPGGPNGPGP